MQDTPFSLDAVEATPRHSLAARMTMLAAVLTVVLGTAVSGYGGYALWQLQNQSLSPITCIETEKQSELYIDVSGAVNSPGVYEVVDGSRVSDAIDAAGGLLAEADAAYIHQSLNMAHNVTDGQKIYIPVQAEQVAQENETTAISSDDQVTQSTTGISINQATATQLESLPGVGPARAKSIMDARPFSAIEELLEKKLVPSTVFSEIAALIQL